MKAKILLFIIAIFSTINIFAYDFCLNGIYYNFKNNNTVEVSSTIGGDLSSIDYYKYNTGAAKRTDYIGNIVIPNTITYNNVIYKVVGIENYAFFKTSITSIEIGPNISSIGKYSLASDSLKDVKWNSKNCTFDYLTIFELNCRRNITSFTIGDSCQFIPDGLCLNMSGLTSINIGKNVREIGSNAFCGCTKLESIIIPKNVESIFEKAFQSCKFNTVTFEPKSKLKLIGSNAFYSCKNLKAINIPDSVKTIGYQTFCSCDNLSNIVLGNQITSIGGMAFAFSAITSIELPASVLELGSGTGQVFQGTPLDTIISYCMIPPTVLVTTFYDVDSMIHVFVPECVVSEYKKTIGWKKFKNYETIPGLCTSVTNVSLKPTSLAINIGDTALLSAIITPSNATNQKINWNSLQPSVVDVSQNGKITAHKTGSATIICTTSDGGYTDSCKVLVKSSSTIPVTSISLNIDSVSLFQGATYTLIAEINPQDATNKNVTWTSSQPLVANISQSGIVTAYTAGTTIITCTTQDGSFKATCNVTVTAQQTVNVTGISLNKTTLQLNEGENDTLFASISPFNATNKNVTWTSSQPLVANISQSGIVTAYSAGSTIITCTTQDGSFKATCNVTVTAQQTVNVTGISLNKTTLQLNEGESDTLFASISPSNATNKNVTWTSSNTDVAIISNGVVTAISEGVSTIECKTVDGTFSAECYVVVSSVSTETDYSFEPITSSIINLNASDLNISSYSEGNFDCAYIVLSNDDYWLTLFYVGQLNDDHLQPGTYFVTSTYEDGTILYSFGGDNSADYGSYLATGFTPDGNYTEAYYIVGGSIIVGKGESYIGTLYTANGSIINVKYNVVTQYTISTSATNGTITGGGTYSDGEQITLTAIPNEHYHFVGWSDGVTSASRAITVTENKSYTANFAIDQYTISAVGVNGTILGTGKYDYGTEITLTAIPNEHYHFVDWSDGVTSESRAAIVTENKSFTANFAIDQYTISAMGTNGIVTGDGLFNYNTQVTLTAIPDEGYEFFEWSDGTKENPYTFRATNDLTLEAIFIEIAEGLVDIYGSDQVTKIIKDNQLYIFQDGKTYNAQGAEVR